jgi:hypothetical protein
MLGLGLEGGSLLLVSILTMVAGVVIYDHRTYAPRQ